MKCVEFHPSARVMLTAGLNQKLSLFQVDGKKNAKIQTIFIEKFPILAAHFTKMTGDEIIMGSRHKSFYVYDMLCLWLSEAFWSLLEGEVIEIVILRWEITGAGTKGKQSNQSVL